MENIIATVEELLFHLNDLGLQVELRTLERRLTAYPLDLPCDVKSAERWASEYLYASKNRSAKKGQTAHYV